MLKKVICIDDDLLSLKLIDHNIKTTLFAETAIKFNRAAEALTYLSSCRSDAPDLRPQLIFLDINIPEINGWPFLHAFNAIYRAAFPDTKVVLLSSNVNPAGWIANYPFVIESIFKPLRIQDLLALKDHPGLKKYFV